MSISWTDVVAIAPDLETIPEKTQLAILAIVNRQISDTQWGVFADDGRRFLAAHYGTSSVSNEGTVVSETLGPMSRTYSVAATSNDAESLSGSRFGREFLRLQKMAVPRFFVSP